MVGCLVQSEYEIALLKGAIATVDPRLYEYGDPTFYEGLNCRGNESHIFDCPVDQSAPTCPYSWEDASIICPGKLSTVQ